MGKNISASKILFRHVDKNKRQQVGIKLRIKKPVIQIDFPVKLSNGESMKLTRKQFQNLTNEHYSIIEMDINFKRRLT